MFCAKFRIVIFSRFCYYVGNKSTKGDTHMVRREKGFKRYAGQRERRFTDPLIREDEYERARAAAERIASRHTGGRADSEDIHNIHRDE